MKLFKRILATALAIALVAIVPSAPKVRAAGTTFTVKYLTSLLEWRVQPLADFDEGKGTGDLGYLYSNVKDGDTVVIVGDASAPALELSVGAKLNNVTIYGAPNGVTFKSGSEVTDAYVLKGSIATLDGTFKNVHVYDDSSCNILKNADLVQACKESKMEMNIVAVGTVAHFQTVDNGKVLKDYYSFGANTLRVEKGELKTAATSYSTTATVSGTTTPATSNAGSTSTSNGGAAVSPKTGETGYAFLLLTGAALCMAGAAFCKKKATR